MSANRSKTRDPKRPAKAVTAARRSTTPRGRIWLWVAVAAVALLGLFVIYTTTSSTSHSAAPAERYQVGSPGIGAQAPDFTLPNATAPPGGPAAVTLSGLRGKTTLLYFHEGLGCQPCWNQIRDLQADRAKLTAAGVDQLLTVTSGPGDLIAQKMRDDGLSAPALVDTDLGVSTRYQANQYGMMGTSTDGHSFVLVGPDGRIQWRADYGGAPNYTMYVGVDRLLADLTAGRRTS